MVIEIKDVSLQIKKHSILKGINLTCEAGHTYGIIGRNGSGKTMLMKCLCGFVRPSAGTVKVFGSEIGKDMDFIPDAGIIIETPGFIPHYSGYRNLKLLAGIQHKISDDDIRNTMRFVGLDPDMKKSTKKYSLGMRQRLGLAQAIMENPKILVLDEPFNGLDKDGVEDMREYLNKLKKEGKTILLASHSAEDIEILCDNVYEMDKGVMTKIR